MVNQNRLIGSIVLNVSASLAIEVQVNHGRRPAYILGPPEPSYSMYSSITAGSNVPKLVTVELVNSNVPYPVKSIVPVVLALMAPLASETSVDNF